MTSILSLKGSIIQRLVESSQKLFGCGSPEDFQLVHPPNISLGDLAVGCFPLAKKTGQPPAKLAASIAADLQPDENLEKATAMGPYINIKVPNRQLFSVICLEAEKYGERFGASTLGASEKVMIEYLSPNTNKPLHLGHIRNGVLGVALSNTLETAGFQVIRANLINDRGVHICKSMLAYQRWGGGETPSSTGEKGDHFVGRWYVRYAKEAELDPSLEGEVKKMLQKWEAGDPETISLWKRMNQWVYEGFAETCAALGLEFDVVYLESDTYKLGKDAVARGREIGVFTTDAEGNTVATVPASAYQRNRPEKKEPDEKKEPKKITVLRPNGTSVYMTQDIGTAILKIEEHGLTCSVYVVGREQNFHFQSLFAILGLLGYPWASKCFHLSYGMVYLPQGKMKSREGKVVDADDLVREMAELALKEVETRYPDLSTDEQKKRAQSIGLAAIKFYLLRQNPTLDIHFNPQESLSFEGETGPYCQYAYARTQSILRKAGLGSGNFHPLVDFALLGKQEELLLVQNLMDFSEVIERAAREYNPASICVWLYQTARMFNQFYHTCRVLGPVGPSLSQTRLKLVKAVSIALKQGLQILGIEPIEEM